MGLGEGGGGARGSYFIESSRNAGIPASMYTYTYIAYTAIHYTSMMGLSLLALHRRIQQRLPAEVLSSLAATLVKEPRTFELVRVLEKVRGMFLVPHYF